VAIAVEELQLKKKLKGSLTGALRSMYIIAVPGTSIPIAESHLLERKN